MAMAERDVTRMQAALVDCENNRLEDELMERARELIYIETARHGERTETTVEELFHAKRQKFDINEMCHSVASLISIPIGLP